MEGPPVDVVSLSKCRDWTTIALLLTAGLVGSPTEVTAEGPNPSPSVGDTDTSDNEDQPTDAAAKFRKFREKLARGELTCEPVSDACLDAMARQEVVLSLESSDNDTLCKRMNVRLPEELRDLPFETPMAACQIPDQSPGDDKQFACRMFSRFADKVQRKLEAGSDFDSAFMSLLEDTVLGRVPKVVRKLKREYRSFRSAPVLLGVRWGMTKREVRSKVPGLKARHGGLGARHKVAGRNAIVAFVFTDGRLAGAQVSFPESIHDPSGAVSSFEHLSTVLASKYGEPEVVEDDPTHGYLLEEIGGLGRAIRLGTRELRHQWTTPESRIEHLLGRDVSGGKREYSHTIRYASEFFTKKAKAQRQQAEAADL